MITISQAIWEQVFAEFATEHRVVEQVCYLDGVKDGESGIVTTLTIPHAKLECGRFQVSPECMSQAGKHFRQLKLRRLAQIHTHPTDWVGHSPWDDTMAYSQLPGAISIVLPNLGRHLVGLAEAGVHLRCEQGWRQLSAKELPEYVRCVPSVLDFRPNRRNQHDIGRCVEPARRKSWWQIIAFWK